MRSFAREDVSRGESEKAPETVFQKTANEEARGLAPEAAPQTRPESRVAPKTKPELKIVEKKPTKIEQYKALSAEKAKRAGELHAENTKRFSSLLREGKKSAKWDKTSPYYKEWLCITRQVAIADKLAEKYAELEALSIPYNQLAESPILPVSDKTVMFDITPKDIDPERSAKLTEYAEQTMAINDQINRLKAGYDEAEQIIADCQREKGIESTNREIEWFKEGERMHEKSIKPTELAGVEFPAEKTTPEERGAAPKRDLNPQDVADFKRATAVYAELEEAQATVAELRKGVFTKISGFLGRKSTALREAEMIMREKQDEFDLLTSGKTDMKDKVVRQRIARMEHQKAMDDASHFMRGSL